MHNKALKMYKMLLQFKSLFVI